MIFVKAGVEPRSVLLVAGVANVAEELKIPLTITSANDSTHKIGSLHYLNAALDIRTRGIAKDRVSAVVDALKVKFPRPAFDVILEKDHIHLEDNRGKRV